MNHEAHQTTPPGPRQIGHGGHRWMMFACCIPMIAIAIALVATGVLGVGFLVIALLCVAVMPLLHGGMSHGEHGRDRAGMNESAHGRPDRPVRARPDTRR